MSLDTLYSIYLQHPVVSTDSRRVPDGCMFFAIKGETFNGNRFAASALEAGAAVAVVDEADVVPAGDERYVQVDDVLTVLQQLAAHHRQQFLGPVLQITGTNGKTTTKELIAAVLSERYRVLYTQGNLNNHIGVPLTLLRLRPDEHDIAVIETGANHPGEIAFLTNIVKPTCGIVTNVGVAHIEGFSSFEGVKHTKGELYDYLFSHNDCRLFLAADNPNLTDMLEQRGTALDDPRIIAYGHEARTGLACCGIVAAANPFVAISWQQTAPQPAKQHEVQTNLIGTYNLDNLLAAVTVGLHFDVAPADINHALGTYQPSLGRSEYRQTASNRLIVDAYNANLTSMKAALANFAALQLPNKMVILGDMNELGTDSDSAHRQVVELVAGCADIKEAWFVGKRYVVDGTSFHLFANVDEVKAHIAAHHPNDMTILIKGSNSIRLHQLPELL